MRQYYYLIASLPLLEFAMKPPLKYSDFLKCSREQLSAHDMDIIQRTKITPAQDVDESQATLREWQIFDITLRNEIVKFRASRKLKDPAKYIRAPGYSDPFIASFAHWVTSQDSPMEAELSLDRERWQRLEELAKAHYFDIDYLITYALQLQILERWQMINSQPATVALEALLEKEII
ncbi:MAG: DUF2764 family protein [Candidatus Omnitrophota bacterium]